MDGGDVLAVYEATRAAVERARPARGRRSSRRSPTATAPHATADDQAAYIDLERVEEEKRNECVGRYERYLQRLGVLTDARAEEIRGEALERMREGSRPPRPSRRRTCRSSFGNASPTRRPRSTRSWPSSGRFSGREREARSSKPINDCFHVELERDDNVMVMGEDVGRAGGVFRATAGLRDRFGADRCVDTPLAEAGILGTAMGLCMAGWRPVCEMQYDAFSYPCLDQLITHVGRYRWRTGGAMEFPSRSGCRTAAASRHPSSTTTRRRRTTRTRRA